MNNHVEKQYNRKLISSEDFLEAKGYLKEAQSNLSSSDTIRKALLLAATISYCRPFTNNSGDRGDGAITIVSGKFINELVAEEKELHETLIELRNTVLAHSDFEKKPCRKMPEKGMSIMGQVDFWHLDIDLFLRLVNRMTRKCIEKNGKLV